MKNTAIFPDYGKSDDIPSYHVNLHLCSKCSLVQLDSTAPPDTMYKNGGYGYKSGVSNTMRTHLKDYNAELRALRPLTNGDTVLDIGSNDGTFLNYYGSDVCRIGIDPAGSQFIECYNYSDMHLIPDYFTLQTFRKHFKTLKCQAVSSICMFYDLPDPVQFATDIHDILADDGIWTCEQSYLLTMLETNSLDTICHEHLEYYSLKPVKLIADKANLKIVDIKFNDSNGGSFRVYFAKKQSKKYTECTDLINEILAKEETYGLDHLHVYEKFISNCDVELSKFSDFLYCIQDSGRSVQIYGASTKGNFILQYLGIDQDGIPYAVERNPKKFGKCTNTGIPIISEETMRADPPDYLVVLPWHFKKEIIERESDYLSAGGQLIFYFPTFDIVSKRPKTLVTGSTGYIASYYIDHMKDIHSLYGVSRRSAEYPLGITHMYMDLNSDEDVAEMITLIKPDNIVHLAGMSSSIDAFNSPIQKLDNSLWVAYLCEAIKNINPNIRMFNPSSSEIYKGHVTYMVNDTDPETVQNICYDSHPYAIATAAGHRLVQHYRSEYGLKISNGILFTVQSCKKSDKFLLNKLNNHCSNWSTNKTPIEVGMLDSSRNMIHPTDVVAAIELIMEQDYGDDYVIANTYASTMRQMVEQLYAKHNIQIQREVKPGQGYVEMSSMLPIIKVVNNNGGLEKSPVCIDGYSGKLSKLGWRIKYDNDAILSEFVADF
jgi:GDP-D-mannose dehydratase